MLYLMLAPLSDDWIFFNLFRYITFRSGAAVLTALVFSWVVGPPFVRMMRKSIGARTPQRAYLENHAHKKGTPILGGLLIVASIVFSTVLWADISNPSVLIVIFVLITFAALGMSDDLFKIRDKGIGLGLWPKLGIQCFLAIIAALLLWWQAPEIRSLLSVPALKDFRPEIGLAGFLVFEVFVIVGSSNAVNITDGLDGLAIVPVVIAAASLAAIAYLVGNNVYSTYLQLDFISGAGELTVFCMSIVGAGLGFLWYNAPPAQIFMGDSGSLALGASLAAVAAVAKHELVLLLIGGLFVLEAVSVIVQVVSFKLTGKRVFVMAPLHHHFERRGWQEATIVIRFWIIAIVLALLGLATLKLR